MPLKKLGEKNFHVINRSVPRIDGVEKVTGRARYANDIHMAGMLYGGVLRSPYSSAKVVRINADKARQIPGVHAVVTCKDMPRAKSWAGYMYLTDIIRYPGDCVAMAAAESLELVDEALEAVEVEYEELPGVYTIDDALTDGAPLVHEKYKNNIFTESYYPIRKGNVDEAFKKADIIVEREYRTQYIEHSYIEPEAVVCFEDPNTGAMTCHASAQNPFFTRRYVADVLGIPMNRVHMVQEFLGGSFGGKEEGVGLCTGRCAYLAKLTGRPVKIKFSREDSFLESAKRHPFRLRYKAGLTKDGKIIAWEGEQVDNCGAYNNQTQFMNSRASIHSAGPYEIDNVKTDTYGVFTNNVHSGAMRGYSSPQLIFGQEQFIEELAEACGMDEVSFRRKNLLHDGALTATGVPVEHCVIKEIMDETLAQTDYVKKRAAYQAAQKPGDGKRRGIGFAVCHRGSGLGAESPDASGCMMICNEDGSVQISSGLAENGQGLRTAYAQIAAEALGVCYENVSFYGTDSHTTPDCGMTVASRGTVMGAQSVRKTGEKLKKIMLQNALDLHALPLSDIEKHYGLSEGSLSYDKLTADDVELCEAEYFLKQYPDVKVPFKNVCNSCLWAGKQMAAFDWFMPEALNQDHHTGQGKAFPTFAYGCIVAEVEVDMRTGYVDVLEVTSSHDVGTAINPALVAGQIYGGIAMGQGFAVTEEVVTGKRGQKTKNFDSYIIPTAMDVPKMHVNIYENDDPAGTYGAKSIGEPATEGVGAAIANAIHQATGRRIYNNPADLENVLLGHKLQ